MGLAPEWNFYNTLIGLWIQWTGQWVLVTSESNYNVDIKIFNGWNSPTPTIYMMIAISQRFRQQNHKFFPGEKYKRIHLRREPTLPEVILKNIYRSMR